ncbi:hypothetical protein OESDEN_23590 [Oesophagostomum dentatum]|uniref:Uncharacterized protein n=1 Tax=Oesophagostomum dentatum TaxID=61180 RepID=A0A0B1S0Q5_OESDE|nr:hypothetical protein OESDEN_23590 [Oesophagostomum dentatum]
MEKIRYRSSTRQSSAMRNCAMLFANFLLVNSAWHASKKVEGLIRFLLPKVSPTAIAPNSLNGKTILNAANSTSGMFYRFF